MITHHQVQQGTQEWLDLRCGLITASCMKLLITPTGKQAANGESRAHLDELLAQRITRHVEPGFQSKDMERGHADEDAMRAKYEAHTGSVVTSVGFVSAVRHGHLVGCSPDGLVGNDGGIEGKSRRQKFQVRTILNGGVPDEFRWQIQGCLYVTGRAWWDFVSYSGGMHMYIHRVLPDPRAQETIQHTVSACEEWLARNMETYAGLTESLPMTERTPVTDEGYKWELEAD